MSDDALDHLLFPPSPPSNAKRPMPNWPQVHRELGRKHLTLDLLWNEYKLQEPDGYGYSWLLAQWAKTDVLVMDDLAMTPLTDSIAYRVPVVEDLEQIAPCCFVPLFLPFPSPA